jgi:hypothetical protein
VKCENRHLFFSLNLQHFWASKDQSPNTRFRRTISKTNNLRNEQNGSYFTVSGMDARLPEALRCLGYLFLKRGEYRVAERDGG